METDSSLINHLYCLSLTIHKGLQITSQFQSIDQFIKIFLSNNEVGRTKIVQDGIWDEPFDIKLIRNDQKISLILYSDNNNFGNEKNMGQVILDLTKFTNGVLIDQKEFMIVKHDNSVVEPKGSIIISLLLSKRSSFINIQNKAVTEEIRPDYLINMLNEELSVFHASDPVRQTLHNLTNSMELTLFNREFVKDLLLELHLILLNPKDDIPSNVNFDFDSNFKIELKSENCYGSTLCDLDTNLFNKIAPSADYSITLLTNDGSRIVLDYQNKFLMWIWVKWFNLASKVSNHRISLSELPSWANSDEINMTNKLIYINYKNITETFKGKITIRISNKLIQLKCLNDAGIVIFSQNMNSINAIVTSYDYMKPTSQLVRIDVESIEIIDSDPKSKASSVISKDAPVFKTLVSNTKKKGRSMSKNMKNTISKMNSIDGVNTYVVLQSGYQSFNSGTPVSFIDDDFKKPYWNTFNSSFLFNICESYLSEIQLNLYSKQYFIFLLFHGKLGREKLVGQSLVELADLVPSRFQNQSSIENNPTISDGITCRFNSDISVYINLICCSHEEDTTQDGYIHLKTRFAQHNGEKMKQRLKIKSTNVSLSEPKWNGGYEMLLKSDFGLEDAHYIRLDVVIKKTLKSEYESIGAAWIPIIEIGLDEVETSYSIYPWNDDFEKNSMPKNKDKLNIWGTLTLKHKLKNTLNDNPNLLKIKTNVVNSNEYNTIYQAECVVAGNINSNIKPEHIENVGVGVSLDGILCQCPVIIPEVVEQEEIIEDLSRNSFQLDKKIDGNYIVIDTGNREITDSTMNRMSSFASFCSKAIAIGKIEVCVQLQSDNVKHCKYHTKIRSFENAELFIDVDGVFNDYRVFNETLLKFKIEADNTFPITHSKSMFGIKLSTSDLHKRCNGIQKWFGVLLLEFDTYPTSAQESIMEFFHHKDPGKKNIVTQLFNTLLEETSHFRVDDTKLNNFDVTDLNLKKSSELFKSTSIEDLEIKVTVESKESDHHCMYMTKIRHVKDKDIILSETKNFDGYRNLYNNIIAQNIMTEVDFPRSYKRSKLGLKLTSEQILNRCEALNNWVGILLTRFCDFPISIQNQIINFFSPEDFSNHPHLQEINKKIFKILSFNNESIFDIGDHENENGDIELHVFENERRSLIPPFEFSHANLSRNDPIRYTNEKGKLINYIPIASSECPAGYEWIKPNHAWSVDLGYTHTDSNGWSYANSFDQLRDNLKHNDSNSEAMGKQCRRKRWFREARKKVIDHKVKEIDVNDDAQNDDHDDENNDISVSCNEPEDTNKHGSPINNPFNFQRNLFKYKSVKDISKYNDMVVFENQRKNRDGKFSHNELLKFERSHFSDESGSRKLDYSPPNLDTPPPIGCVWHENWVLEVTNRTGKNGWMYDNSFGSLMNSYRLINSNSNSNDPIPNRETASVRRRKWVRKYYKSTRSLELNSRSLTKLPSPLDRLNLFTENNNLNLSLCKEKVSSVSSLVLVPWNQLVSIEVITPGILFLQVEINKYFGEDSDYNEIYHPSVVNIFIEHCPAMELYSLINERVELKDIRIDIKEFIALEKTIQKQEELVEQKDNRRLLMASMLKRKKSSLIIQDEDDGVDFVPETQELSLGNSTIANLDRDSTTYERRFMELKELFIMYPNNLFIKNELYITMRRICRLRLYIALLLGDIYPNPEMFKYETIMKLIQKDFIHSRLIKMDDDVDTTKNRIEYLIDSMESRIGDITLHGWSYRGGLLEKALELILNEYLHEMINLLSKFFEDENKNLMNGLSSKITLIKFLTSHDDRVHQMIQSNLRTYDQIAFPSPKFSLFLDVNTLLIWYVQILKDEMIGCVDNTVNVWKDKSKNASGNDANYKFDLPWIPMRQYGNSGVFQTLIPEDSISYLLNYLEVARIANTDTSETFQIALKTIDDKLPYSYINACIYLCSLYSQPLSSKDWTNTANNNYEDIIAQLDEHLEWICSVGNDGLRIEDKLLFTNQNINLQAKIVNKAVIKLHYQFHVLSNKSWFYSSNIIFKALITEERVHEDGNDKWNFMDIDFYTNWELLVTNEDETTDNGIFNIISNDLVQYLISKQDYYEPEGFFQIVNIASKKLILLYMGFLKLCSSCSISFNSNSNEVSQILLDIDSMKNNLTSIIKSDQNNELSLQIKNMINNNFSILDDSMQILSSEDVEDFEFGMALKSFSKRAQLDPGNAIFISKYVEMIIFLRSDHKRKSGMMATAKRMAKRVSISANIKSSSIDSNEIPEFLNENQEPIIITNFFVEEIRNHLDTSVASINIYNPEFILVKAMSNFSTYPQFIKTYIYSSSEDEINSYNRVKFNKDSNNNNLRESIDGLSLYDRSSSICAGSINRILISDLEVKKLFYITRFTTPSPYLHFSIMGDNKETSIQPNCLAAKWIDETGLIDLQFSGSMSQNVTLFVTLFYKALVYGSDKIATIKINLSTIDIEHINKCSYEFSITDFAISKLTTDEVTKINSSPPELIISIKHLPPLN